MPSSQHWLGWGRDPPTTSRRVGHAAPPSSFLRRDCLERELCSHRQAGVSMAAATSRCLFSAEPPPSPARPGLRVGGNTVNFWYVSFLSTWTISDRSQHCIQGTCQPEQADDAALQPINGRDHARVFEGLRSAKSMGQIWAKTARPFFPLPHATLEHRLTATRGSLDAPWRWRWRS